MKTLVIGNRGRMGRRYETILDHLEEAHTGVDKERYSLSGFSHVIIATPTPTHFDILTRCIEAGVPNILCEKPLCASLAATRRLANIKTGSDIRLVCNWAFVFDEEILEPRGHDIEYSNWMSGDDGEAWDCCQLYYLSRSRPVIRRGPYFRSTIDGRIVTLSDIDWSYIDMLYQWYKDPRALWGIDDAVAMEQIVEEEL